MFRLTTEAQENTCLHLKRQLATRHYHRFNSADELFVFVSGMEHDNIETISFAESREFAVRPSGETSTI
jgi:hypothetical protein